MNIVSMLVIYNDKGEILLQDRANIKTVWEDYSFFGGHLEQWETPDETLQREIKEELDIELNTWDYEFLGIWNKNVYKTGKNYDIYFYLYRADQDVFTDREGSGASFWEISQAKRNKFVAPFEDILDFLEIKIKDVLRSAGKK